MIRPDDRHNSEHRGNSFGRQRRPDSEETIFTRHRILLEGHARSIYGILWVALDMDQSDWLAAANAQAGAHCDHCLVARTLDRMAVASAKAIEPARPDGARTHQCSQPGIAKNRERGIQDLRLSLLRGATRPDRGGGRRGLG